MYFYRYGQRVTWKHFLLLILILTVLKMISHCEQICVPATLLGVNQQALEYQLRTEGFQVTDCDHADWVLEVFPKTLPTEYGPTIVWIQAIGRQPTMALVNVQRTPSIPAKGYYLYVYDQRPVQQIFGRNFGHLIYSLDVAKSPALALQQMAKDFHKAQKAHK